MNRVKFPRIFMPLFNHHQFKAYISGRGGGKSWQFARALIIMAARKKMFIVCAREVMESIRDSVHRLLENQIEALGLSGIFRVYKYSIKCTLTGSEFVFKGLFNQRSAESMKSLEGADILWVEEAQTASAETVELVFPSIRKPGSEIWCSMNGRFRSDPIYRMFFTGKPPEGSLVQRTSWRDNEHFTAELNAMRLITKQTQPERYQVVWEGAVDDEGAQFQVLPYGKLLRCVDAHIKLGLDVAGPRDAGLDIADTGPDKNAYAVRQGPLVEDAISWEACLLHKTASKADKLNKTLDVQSLYFDANGCGAGIRSDADRMEKNPETGEGPNIGAFIPYKASRGVQGPDRKYIKGLSSGKGISNKEFFRNINAQSWWNLRLRMNNTLAALDGADNVDYDRCLFINGRIENIEGLLEQMSQCIYDDTGLMRVDKNPNNEDSPDRADAVVMAFTRDLKKGLTI